MVRLTKASRPRGYVDTNRFGILNPWGDIWTSETFKSEAEARKHIEDFCRLIDDAGSLTRFKVVPVRVHVTAIRPALEAHNEQ